MLADSAKDKAKFQFGEFEFVYEKLMHTSDDHKDAYTAQVAVYHHGEHVDTLYPAKWDYHKGESQVTSEIAIAPRAGLMATLPTEWWGVLRGRMLDEMAGGDVYIVLTGYDLESGLVNLRVFLKPLILWVWLGFLILALGTLVCLIPQGLVDRLSRPRTTRLGRAADIAVLALIVTGVLAGLANQAQAAAPAEHVAPGMGMGADSTGYAAMNRPTNATEERLMKELLCVCGGCQRENLYDCKCPTAARMRRQVMDVLRTVDDKGKLVHDLNTPASRDKAFDEVLDTFVKSYGGEQVLATPRTSASWMFPTVGVLSGLALLVVVGRRWVHRGTGTSARATAAAVAANPDDEAYADKLDDELADTD